MMMVLCKRLLWRNLLNILRQSSIITHGTLLLLLSVCKSNLPLAFYLTGDDFRRTSQLSSPGNPVQLDKQVSE